MIHTKILDTKILVLFDIELFSQTITTTPEIRYNIGKIEAITGLFPVRSKSTLGKWSKAWLLLLAAQYFQPVTLLRARL